MVRKVNVIALLIGLLAACAKVPEPERSLSPRLLSKVEASKGRRAEGPTPALQAIDSLMWQQPDSALLALMAYEGDASEYNHHYAQLLTSELLYKNYYEQTNRLELQQAVVYFDSLLCQFPPLQRGLGGFKTRPLAARAHYINGVGYYERDSVIDACREYLKALEVMEGHFEEKELVGKMARFMALAFSHLKNLFSDFYLHEQAIYFAQCSLPYYEKQESTSWYLSWALNQIGSHYDMMGVMDSADCYYKKALGALDDKNTIMFRDIAAHQAYLEYKKDSKQADESILRLFQLLSESENDMERVARRALIGEIYYHEKYFDSAWYHLNTVYHETSNISTKKQVAEWLTEICKAQGRTLEMLDYAEFLVPFANQEENSSGLKSQLTEFYNSFKQNELEQKHHKEMKARAKLALLVFGGMLVVMLVVVLFYRKNKQSKQKLETQMEAERHAHKMQQAALAGRLRRSNAALKAQGRTKPASPTPFVQDRDTAENYAEESICRQILSVCNDTDNPIKSTVPVSAYANIALTDAQKAQLKEAATRHYGLFFEKLKQQHPELKEKDLLYCQLCLLGLDNVQIAVLTQLSYRTVWEREKRLQTVFHSDEKVSVVLHGMMMD